jgi:hypothetical protein
MKLDQSPRRDNSHFTNLKRSATNMSYDYWHSAASVIQTAIVVKAG